MELRHLRYFVAVAEELSFTAAAHRLHVSQPPLSQQIRQLEAELGTPLFNRSSRRVELTAAGAAYLGRVRTILSGIEQASEEARVIGAGQLGTLDVGTTGSVLLGPLAALVQEYRARYPKVTVRLHEMPPRDQHAALVGRRTDISFMRRPPDDPDLVCERAWSERVCAVLPRDHRLAASETVALASLRDESFVFLRLEDSSFAQYLWSCCVEAGFTPRVSQQAVESYALIGLVAAKLGVALVPEGITTLVHPGVVCRPLSRTTAAADVAMLYRSDRTVVLDNFLDVARPFLSGSRATPNVPA